jgi:hypothetical protein
MDAHQILPSVVVGVSGPARRPSDPTDNEQAHEIEAKVLISVQN